MFRLALHWQILIAMILGAVVGIGLNLSAGRLRMSQPVDIVEGSVQLRGMSKPADLHRGSVWVEDAPNQILIQVVTSEEAIGHSTRRIVVRGQLRQPHEDWMTRPSGMNSDVPRTVVPTVGKLMEEDPEAYALFQLYGRSTARRVGDAAGALGGLFLRLLKMVAVPLIVTSLIAGVTGLGQADRLGKMFGRTLLYYVATSMLAIVVGLLAVNLIRPGEYTTDLDPAPAASEEVPESPQAANRRVGKGLGTVLFEQVENMIPMNPFGSLAAGNFLSIISFSLLFGIFAILVGGKTGTSIRELAEALFEIMMRMTMAIIALAPLGVFFLMLAATAGRGIGVFGTLGWYMVAVAVALAFHACVTLPLILKFIARRSPLDYAKAMSPALLTAFSSASSNGTLPLTMTCAEERAGVSNRVTSFVLPLGATINMDGTALYEVVAVLFIAQFTPGVDLTLSQQVIVAFTALLASIGAAGIPHAGLIMMVIILQAVGLPTESQGLIIAVDRILDMCRTSVNVWSDSCGCAVISRFES